MKKRHLTMLTDLYQITMIQGYFKNNMHEREAVFDMFFRKGIGDSAYCIMAGLEQAIDGIENLKFTIDDIEYLRSLGIFQEDFLEYISQLRFTGDIHAMPEGSVVFPYEPLLRVKAPLIQAQLVETMLLNTINHQTLIATKASRVCSAAAGADVIEFGLRRAQGPDAGLYGSRAAVIGGCAGTSNVLAGQMFGVAPKGTQAHSWVMSFDTELESFYAYADLYPDACLLLVDTYDTLGSGVLNAIEVFKYLRKKGHEPVGIRLDSGDLAYLSKTARKMLDEAGFKNAKIFASSDLDEYVIRELRLQGACIDFWGVGTRLITSQDCPALGGVYKLSAQEVDGNLVPRIKISDNALKITNPGYKKVVRIYQNSTKKAIADLIMLDEETIDETKPLTIFDPIETWKKMTISDFNTRELLVPVFLRGKKVYECPDVLKIREYAQKELATFWDEYKRITKPHIYKVDLSDKLYELKKSMLDKV